MLINVTKPNVIANKIASLQGLQSSQFQWFTFDHVIIAILVLYFLWLIYLTIKE